MLNRRDFLKNALVIGAGLTVHLPMPVTSGISPKERGKYGFINKMGDVIIRPLFDTVYTFNEGLAKVCIGGKCGFVDRNGKIVIKPWLDAEENFFEFDWNSFSLGLAKVSVDGKLGFMDRFGKLVVPAIYDDALTFEDDITYVTHVRKGDTQGFINQTGKMVIDNSSYEIDGCGFSDGLCGIVIDGKHGCIDTDGRIVIPPISETALYFFEGTSPVKINGKQGYLDMKGFVTIKPVFDDAGFFSEGLAPVKVGDSWGYINKEGRFLISTRFEDACSFRDGRAMVTMGGEYLLIDRRGEVVFRYGDKTPIIHGSFLLAQEALQPAKDANGNRSFIDAKGEAVISLEEIYLPSNDMENGYCNIKTNGRWGLMDNKGNCIIKPAFMNSIWFEEDIAAVETESGKDGFIDMKGRFVIRPQFTDAKAFSDGLAAVKF